MKKETNSSSRRDFLKTSAISAAVAVAGSSSMNNLFARTDAWQPGIKINPNISDKRVAYIKDLTMIPRTASNMELFSSQNDALDSNKIKLNMDKIACALANKPKAADSWATIFMKPTAKTWAQCKVYIKVNAADQHAMSHIPIVSKVCEELIKLGVSPGGITVADPSRNAHKPHNTALYGGNEKYDMYENGKGLPVGVFVRDEEYLNLDGYQRTNGKDYVWTWQGPSGGVDIYATKALATSVNKVVTYTADIVVNISVNKGHGKRYMGGCTLTMKNHIGTFANHVAGKPFTSDNSNPEYCAGKPYTPYDPNVKGTPDMLIAMSKHEMLMGGGTAAYPCRQQLCIVDSLWAASTGPYDPYNKTPGIIAMGTCSPWVDWAVSQKIRIAEMGVDPTKQDDPSILGQFLQGFGYSSSDTYEWINAANTPVTSQIKPSSQGMLFTLLLKGNIKQKEIQFNLPESATTNSSIKIFDMSGKQVRDLGPIATKSAVWDGRTNSGRKIAAGQYQVRITCGSKMFSKSIAILG